MYVHVHGDGMARDGEMLQDWKEGVFRVSSRLSGGGGGLGIHFVSEQEREIETFCRYRVLHVMRNRSGGGRLEGSSYQQCA